MDIVIQINSPEPVYEQIVRQIHDGVRSGQLAPETPLPPVRQLAGDLGLNRNTVARAYKLLEEQGVIQTARRKGKFVRSNAASEVTQLKKNQAQRIAQRMIQTLVASGLSRDEISGVFHDALLLETKGTS